MQSFNPIALGDSYGTIDRYFRDALKSLGYGGPVLGANQAFFSANPEDTGTMSATSMDPRFQQWADANGISASLMQGDDYNIMRLLKGGQVVGEKKYTTKNDLDKFAEVAGPIALAIGTGGVLGQALGFINPALNPLDPSTWSGAAGSSGGSSASGAAASGGGAAGGAAGSAASSPYALSGASFGTSGAIGSTGAALGVPGSAASLGVAGGTGLGGLTATGAGLGIGSASAALGASGIGAGIGSTIPASGSFLPPGFGGSGAAGGGISQLPPTPDVPPITPPAGGPLPTIPPVVPPGAAPVIPSLIGPSTGGVLGSLLNFVKDNPRLAGGLLGGLLGGTSGSSGGGGYKYTGPMPTISREGWSPTAQANLMPTQSVVQGLPQAKGQQYSGLLRFLGG